MRGRLEPKDTVERFWGLKFIGFPNLSDETPKPWLCEPSVRGDASFVAAAVLHACPAAGLAFDRTPFACFCGIPADVP